MYVGARGLGPDDPPWTYVGSYVGHFAVYPRHAYILVVPAASDEGIAPAFAYSFSLEGDFLPNSATPREIYTRRFAYIPHAYENFLATVSLSMNSSTSPATRPSLRARRNAWNQRPNACGRRN